MADIRLAKALVMSLLLDMQVLEGLALKEYDQRRRESKEYVAGIRRNIDALQQIQQSLRSVS